jgi:hypothetical protein
MSQSQIAALPDNADARAIASTALGTLLDTCHSGLCAVWNTPTLVLEGSGGQRGGDQQRSPNKAWTASTRQPVLRVDVFTFVGKEQAHRITVRDEISRESDSVRVDASGKTTAI